LGADLVAGLGLFALAVPEQIATAHLAVMPAAAGLYAFVAGSLMFAVIGSHRHMSVGADSTIAPVFAAGVAAVAVAGTPRYTHLVTFMALLVGVLIVAVGLLRLGWISKFLSSPVITGILAGIAVEIVVRQLPAVLGIPGGGTTTVGRLRNVFDQLGQVNGWAVGIAVFVFLIIVVAHHIDRRIPGPLLALLASIGAFAGGLKAHGVASIGAVHGGLPTLSIPPVQLADLRRVLGPALTVAFVCVVQTAATARSSETDPSTSQEFDRDLVALGAGNLLAGLSGSFPVDASPPRTQLVTDAGGRSQLTGVVAAAGVLAVAVFATDMLRDIPQATLGAILIFVATRLFRATEFRQILRFDHFEFALAVVTATIVALIGVEQGIVVAAVVALAQRTRLAAQPRDVVLGRVPGTDHWIPPNVGRPTEQAPGVLVYLLYAPLWYGDADYVAGRIRAAVAAAPQPVHVFILDSNGISDIDYSAARVLGELAGELRQAGLRIGVARASHLVRDSLKLSGVLSIIGAERLFPSVEDAVTALTREP
jgi:high affinity sulfate transporter 1